MKAVIPIIAFSLLLAACGRQESPPPPREDTIAKSDLEFLRARNATLEDQVAELDGQLRDARMDAAPRPAPAVDDTALKAAKARIAELEAEVAGLKADREAASVSEPATEPATEPPAPDADVEQPNQVEIKQRMDELLPIIKQGNHPEAINEYAGLLSRVDKESRDAGIAAMQQWVKDDPENKHAHLALAVALTTRFRDLRDPMKQGALAAEVKSGLDRAMEIDPDYYDAVHFLAIMKVNYPSFTPEFKTAPETLQRALDMHKDLPWQERFAEIYAAWGQWHRVQGQLDDAAARVKQGLDQWPTNQGLLDEQALIAAAKEKANHD